MTSREKCPTCGSNVRIEGDTTKYYVPVNYEPRRFRYWYNSYSAKWETRQISGPNPDGEIIVSEVLPEAAPDNRDEIILQLKNENAQLWKIKKLYEDGSGINQLKVQKALADEAIRVMREAMTDVSKLLSNSEPPEKFEKDSVLYITANNIEVSREVIAEAIKKTAALIGGQDK